MNHLNWMPNTINPARRLMTVRVLPFTRFFVLIWVLLLGTMIVTAQTNSATTNKPAGPPPGTELFPSKYNGEVVAQLGNYWDGVDDNNNLHVMVSTFPVLNDVGRMVSTRFAPTVNFIDMNDDGLKDLIVGDTYGFLWIYFNSGEKGKPKFTTGTLMSTFLGWASKIHVTDWDNDGDNDIVIGSYYGDFVVLFNMGGPKNPVFIHTMGVPRYVSPYYSVKNPQHRLKRLKFGKEPIAIGLYMSPWVADWNHDGKPDLIFGEGTYSANSIRIAINQGSRGKPAFVKSRVFYLAYGEGFEQLTPSVVDYNGDSIPDMMCGTRTGQIRLHKGTTNAVDGADIVSTLRGTKAPAALQFDRFLPIGGKTGFDTMTNPFPCDWNEDGLFDILVGSTKGVIYIALNKGTKTEPSFPDMKRVKGTNVDKDMLAPVGWWNGIGHGLGSSRLFGGDYIGDACNAAVLLSAEKEVAMKPSQPPVKPEDGKYFAYFRYAKNYPGWTIKDGTISAKGNRRILFRDKLKLEIGKRYTFSFSSILFGRMARWQMIGYERFEGTREKPPYYKRYSIGKNISPSTSWKKNTLTFVCPGVQKGEIIAFSLGFIMPEGDCKFCFDNLSLKEVAGFHR